MSQSYCMAVFTTPPLSTSALSKLGTLTGIDWAHLWQLVLQYGPEAIKALETVLAFMPAGAVWADVLKEVLAILSGVLPQPAPTP